MNIEDIWSSRPWSELTSEERIATVRLILKSVATELKLVCMVDVIVNSKVVPLENFAADMAPDVARLLDRVISPAGRAAPEAVAALEGDLRAQSVVCQESSLLAFGAAILDGNIKAEAGSY